MFLIALVAALVNNVPTREIYGNINLGQIIYVFDAALVVLLVLAIRKRVSIWKLGKPDIRDGEGKARIWPFIKVALSEGLGHKRMLREPYPGLMHFLIFWACVIFLIATALESLSHYTTHFLKGDLYVVYSLVTDIFGILIIVGVLIAAYRRYVQKPDRLDNKPEDAWALVFIVVVVLSGFVVEGFRMAAFELGPHPDWGVLSPAGLLVANMLSGVSREALLEWHRITWWAHFGVYFLAVGYICVSFNKLSHIIVSPWNAYFRNLGPKSALTPIDLEKAETFGVAKIQDFTWKQLLDLDACTRCGRCQDNCPAHLTGKPLNPKKVIQDLKGHLLERAPALLAAAAAPAGEGGARAEPSPPAKDMIHEIITDEVLWDCTTCRACMEACPVFIEHVPKIIDMRRNLVLEQSQMPETAAGALKSVEARGHPWRGTTATRTDWAKGIEVKVLADNKNIDILYWVGCTAALEDRSMKISAAFARLMKEAGVNFGILGSEEFCCGDPPRRMGNEYLFQMMAQRNVETMNGYGVKKIVTSCPHCFNIIKHEYAQFGGKFEVVHHTEFLLDLLAQGKLKMGKEFAKKIVYHDACYLGRYNDIFAQPRDIISRVPGAKKAEMGRRTYRSFCCGAGGGRLWMEERTGKRINETRTEEALATGADVIATACPYCMQMFVDGLKTKGAEEKVRAMDLAEIIEAAR
ncbi:MAG: (Fe-S)-binding protein [Chloroflexi bacterium]|nr:(Fe-S)-binding protein [Chloroflexota bacterium]